MCKADQLLPLKCYVTGKEVKKGKCTKGVSGTVLDRFQTGTQDSVNLDLNPMYTISTPNPNMKLLTMYSIICALNDYYTTDNWLED